MGKFRKSPLAVTVSTGLVCLFGLGASAATVEVGPGQTYTNLGSVPWTALNPGDTVNIHYQAGGYHEIVLLSNSGVSNAPITINGVPDPATGSLPTIDGQNAVTASNTLWNDVSLNQEGVIVISPASRQPYGYIPSWIVISNLQIQNASPGSELTTSQGITTNFDSAAAAIYVQFAQHLVVHGCELNGSCNGFFCDSEGGDPNQTSADVLIENSHIHDNGFPNNYEAHNIYTQARGVTFQYNIIGPLRPGAAGDDIKDESSGTILRYNEVILGTGGLAFWFVQPQGGVGVIDQDPAYHTNYVYGNVFYNCPASGALTLFVYDSDGIEGEPRNGTLYFYNNTVVNYANQSQRYYTELFQLPTHDEVLAWNVHDVLDCRNNIFAAIPATAGNSPTLQEMLIDDDSTMNLGANWVTPGTLPLTLPYGTTNFYGAVTGTNELIIGDSHGLNNPGFVNVAATNFNLLSSSPAIDTAGPQSPGVLASPNNVVYEYVDPTNEQLRVVNGLGLDLGAFEGMSTNFTGPLYSVTVSNGFGSGGFPLNATVPVSADPAPPGQAFAGWTGYPVANPASIGTSFTMPPGDVTVIATYTNLPAPTHFILDVINGSGSGSYLPGAIVTITATTPPTGETFTGWTGVAVADASAASTTLTMPASNVTVIANYEVSSTFNLTVVNGGGSGAYAPGAVVPISANDPPVGEVFSGWSGYAVADASATNTTLDMPNQDVIVTANFVSTNNYSAVIPCPVSSHPRLWITTNDLPRLRSWATPANPIYMAVRNFLTNSIINYDTQYFPGGVESTNYPDFGDPQGYTGLITEEDAIIFALFSLIDPDPSVRPVYAQHAAALIRVAAQQAALGPLAGAPFRDPTFPTYNRANASLKLFPLAVDWIYNATDTNGQPVLSAADKLTIRNAFMIWAELCRHAETAGGDSPPPDVINDPTVLCPGNSAYRMAANNYYLGHARLMTMMSLAIDPADDPPVNPAAPVSAETNSLRSYITIANGAWLFQEYAMFGEGDQVAEDYGLPGLGANFGKSSGGMPPEGMLYGESFGFIFNQLLALQTAGFNNTNFAGPQIKLIHAPVWDRFCNAWMNMLTPLPVEIESYDPTAYQMFSYGDVLRLYAAPDFSDVFSALMLLDRETGNTNRLAKTTWLAVQAPQGGYADLINRAGTSWGAIEAYEEGLLYFLTLDPAQLAPPPDPRPAQPAVFYDPAQGTLAGVSDWTANRSMINWRCSWISINHQNGDAGMIQFFRKGEFLTKELTGYDNAGYGQASWLHNTLALQNYCAAGIPANLQWYEAGLWATGSQWQLGANAGDPTARASAGSNYVFTYGDLTPLYNRPSPYEPGNAALDILQANRSVLWLKPDHLLIYDRATSQTAGLFKRFNLCLPTRPVVASLPGGGSSLTETMASGQQLFIQSLLPANGIVTVASLSNVISTVAEGEPDNYRIAIEDTNNPTDIRFLHVLQGADAGVGADAVTCLHSSGGNAFEGAAVRGVDILFPVNVLSNNFTGVNWTAPLSLTNHYLAGLTPGAGYAVTVQTNAGQLSLNVMPGSQISADNAGLLSFDNAGRNLNPVVPPQWTSIATSGPCLQLTGAGNPIAPYQIQASTNLNGTNWTTIGASTADGSGQIQFSDPNAGFYRQRFYRLSSP